MRLAKESIDKIIGALIEGVKDTGEFMYARSQANIQKFTDDGTLLASGYFDRQLTDGFEIGYRAIHAGAVERGHGPIVIRNPVPRAVGPHMRGRPGQGNRSINVRPYMRTYQTGAVGFLRYGGRDIGFRVIGTESHPIPEEPGKWYLAQAVSDGVKHLPDFLLRRLDRIR